MISDDDLNVVETSRLIDTLQRRAYESLIFLRTDEGQDGKAYWLSYTPPFDQSAIWLTWLVQQMIWQRLNNGGDEGTDGPF